MPSLDRRALGPLQLAVPVGHLGPCPGWHTTVAREGLVLGQAAALGGSLGLFLRALARSARHR